MWRTKSTRSADYPSTSRDFWFTLISLLLSTIPRYTKKKKKKTESKLWSLLNCEFFVTAYWRTTVNVSVYEHGLGPGKTCLLRRKINNSDELFVRAVSSFSPMLIIQLTHVGFIFFGHCIVITLLTPLQEKWNTPYRVRSHLTCCISTAFDFNPPFYSLSLIQVTSPGRPSLVWRSVSKADRKWPAKIQCWSPDFKGTSRQTRHESSSGHNQIPLLTISES